MRECPEAEKEAKTSRVRTGASATEGPSHGARQCLGGQLVKAWHPEGQGGDAEVVLETSRGLLGHWGRRF